MNSTIRAFIAVDISPAIRSQAQKAVKPLQNAFPDVKWVDDENFHVTLKFLGPNVPTTELHLLIAAIERACKGVEQFDLVFEGLGAFPDSSNPRSIWIGVTDGIDEIRNLAARIDKELEDLGYPVEGREFRPHLTIGRARKKDRNVKVKIPQYATVQNATNSQNASLADMLNERSDLYFGTSPVDNVVLYSSDLQRGAIHTVHLGSVTGADGGKLSLRFETMASVTDGTSNTAIFTEHHQPKEMPRRGTFWASVPANHVYTCSPKAATLYAQDWTTCLNTCGLGSPQNTYFCGRSAGSYHSGGNNAALLDGSVRFISQTINVGTGWVGSGSPPYDIGVWGCMCAVADGETRSSL